MIVGLTGGIGSGKTTVSKMFSVLGVPVYIADIEAKQLMRTSKSIKREIIAEFGEEAYVANKPNASYLAGIVFNNKEKLNALNNIIHPEVKKHFIKWYKEQTSPYVIKEAAVLFENGGYKECNLVITVIAPIEVRIDRVITRDNTTREEVLNRIENQLPDDEKVKLSDYVISNDTLEKTQDLVRKIHFELLAKTR